MKWMVVVNSEGVQAQIHAGRDPEKAGIEQKAISRNAYAKIRFIFETGKNPEGDYKYRREFQEYQRKETEKLHKKYGAPDPAMFRGYNMRKSGAIGDGMEVVADLDAKDFEEFQKKYSGIDGAIDILLSTERILSGRYDRDNPGKSVSKLIRKLELEKEDY